MLSRTVCRLSIFPTAFPSSAYHFGVKLLSLARFIKNKKASPYTAIDNGSSGVVPPLDKKTFFYEEFGWMRV